MHAWAAVVVVNVNVPVAAADTAVLAPVPQAAFCISKIGCGYILAPLKVQYKAYCILVISARTAAGHAVHAA